jgi:hypothetical protein
MKERPTIIKPNGDAATTLSPAQQECIKLCRDMLESAEQGDLHALVVVAVGPRDFGIAMAGSDAAKMYMGCGVAQRTLLERTAPPVGGGRTVLHR